MFISKRKNGFYYVFFINEKGKKNSLSTGKKTKSEALKFLTSFEQVLLNKKSNPFPSKQINQFLFDFVRYSESFHRPKTTKQFIAILKEFSHFTNNAELIEINQQIAESYLQHKVIVSLFTAQKHLAYLRSAFNKATEEKIIPSNPFNSIKNFRLPEKQPLFFDEISFRILIRTIEDKDIKDIVIFAANTGLRLNEVISIEWSQVNFKDKYLILDNNKHTTKSKRIRAVPLNIETMQLLIEREQCRKNEFVFTYRDSKFNPEFLSKRFKKYVRNAKLNPKLKFHSLRHTFASWLVQRGASIYEIQKLLGHQDIKTATIYSHLRNEDLRKAINLLNN